MMHATFGVGPPTSVVSWSFFFEGNSRCSAFSLIVGSRKNKSKNRNQKHNKKTNN